MKRILNLDFLPLNIDLGLFALRIIVSLSLFTKHGLEKWVHFADFSAKNMDPKHIGAMPTLLYATFCDSICAILLLVGFATRFSALCLTISMIAIFTVMHHASFMEEHAEIVWLYLGGFLTLLFGGAGKYSVDAKWLNK